MQNYLINTLCEIRVEKASGQHYRSSCPFWFHLKVLTRCIVSDENAEEGEDTVRDGAGGGTEEEEKGGGQKLFAGRGGAGGAGMRLDANTTLCLQTLLQVRAPSLLLSSLELSDAKVCEP